MWEGLEPRTVIRLEREGIADVASLRAWLERYPTGNETIGRVMLAELGLWLERQP